MKMTNAIFVLNSVKLTESLTLEKIAVLSDDAVLNEDLLPEDFSVYYRVGLDCKDQGTQYITDWGGGGISPDNLGNLISFLNEEALLF